MKVQVETGKGPIAGNYGVKNDGEIFNVPGHQGKDLAESGLVKILDDADTLEDAPKKGQDMTRVRKSEKQAAQRQTKEEKNQPEDKAPNNVD